VSAAPVVDELAAATERLEDAPAEAILRWAFDRFDRVAVVASFQAESVVIIDIASRIRPGVDVVTLDTGRLPEATHDLIDVVHRRFPIRLHVVTPDPAETAAMTAEHGVNLFRRSPDLRHLCCEVRKTRPLDRALHGYDAWVTGLRREQSSTRSLTSVVARDHAHGGIAKLAPLAGWTREQVWRHLQAHDLPHHALYDRGYTSIGCAPCTRATRPGEDQRAGRWWWESDTVKECGLHP
jgi:phosphoadenosine phosphosulfate reductase